MPKPGWVLVLLLSLIFLLVSGCGLNSLQNPSSHAPSNPGQETSLPAPVGPLKGGEVLSGVIGLNASPLAVDQDNILWIAAQNSIVALQDNQFQTFDLYNTRLPHTVVNRILVDKDNKKWFGTGWGDVFTFDNQKWEVLPTPQKTRSILAIRQDSAGTIWVLGQKEYAANSGISDFALWSYKNGSLDQIPVYDFTHQYPSDFIIDSDNNFWFLMGGGLVKYNGQTWEDLTAALPLKGGGKIAYDDQNNVLYLFSFGLKNGDAVISEGGIMRYRAGQFEVIATEKSGLPATQYIGAFSVDKAGKLWISYDQKPTSLAGYDGLEWTTYGPISPGYLGSRVFSVVSDNNGRIWLGGNTASPKGACLARLDGGSLTAYPVLMDDPRTWWRTQSLAELYQLPVSSADIQEILKDPISHRGQKIRLIGSFESSFEYVNLVDLNGNKLNIWPETNLELNQFLQDQGWLDDRSGNAQGQLPKSELKEIVGFLEFGGSYGHMGGWPYRLYITEYYPHSSLEQENKQVHDLYAAFITTLGQDDQSIRAVIAQWALALKTGDIAKMQEVYSPASHFYQSLSESFAQDYYQNNKINFDIKNMAITVQGSGARVKILEVTVIPDKYFTPTGNVRVIGDGLYQLRSIDLVKNANAWKINDFDYSPEYELPAITPPLRQP